MRRNKSRVKIFKSDRAREWATDFTIGIGMFILVAFFASTHTNSALPAPLAKTRAVLEQTIATPSTDQKSMVGTTQFQSFVSSSGHSVLAKNIRSDNNIMMIFVALIFSALLTMTIQFWRNLRRAYASPRRKWGKG
jgi:hypothetical protein